MTDRRSDNYHEYYWCLVDSIIDTDGSEYQTGSIVTYDYDVFKVYQSQYLFEGLDLTKKYILQVVPDNIKNIDKSIECYLYTTNTINILGIYDINSLSTWDVLWELGVEMFLFQTNIINTLSYNDYYVPLVWYLEKIQKTKKIDKIPDNIAFQILKNAISENHLDIIQYITRNISTDLSVFCDSEDMIISLSKLISHQNVEKDFCYYTIEYLTLNGLFKSIVTKELITSMFLTILNLMGHSKTAKFLQNYGFK